MYELTKAIFLLAISAPILYGVNSLTNSVSSYPDPSVFVVSSEAIPTQAYDQGTDSFHQVRISERNWWLESRWLRKKKTQEWLAAFDDDQILENARYVAEYNYHLPNEQNNEENNLTKYPDVDYDDAIQ